jgi:hypothetical protein
MARIALERLLFSYHADPRSIDPDIWVNYRVSKMTNIHENIGFLVSDEITLLDSRVMSAGTVGRNMGWTQYCHGRRSTMESPFCEFMLCPLGDPNRFEVNHLSARMSDTYYLKYSAMASRRNRADLQSQLSLCDSSHASRASKSSALPHTVDLTMRKHQNTESASKSHPAPTEIL